MSALLEQGALNDGVVLLTLSHPSRRNALSVELCDSLSDHLDALAAHDDVRAVVVTGAGEAFCAGFDLTEFEQADEDPSFARTMWASSDRFHHTCLRFPLPLLAAVHGPAVGAGFDLATMCDLRVMHVDAWFERPEVSFTIPLYSILHDLVGGALARDLTLTRRRFTAREAHQIGLVNRLVERGDVIEASLELARQIAQAKREDLLASKRKIIACGRLAAYPTLEL